MCDLRNYNSRFQEKTLEVRGSNPGSGPNLSLGNRHAYEGSRSPHASALR